jgi:hypothetical protein
MVHLILCAVVRGRLLLLFGQAAKKNIQHLEGEKGR